MLTSRGVGMLLAALGFALAGRVFGARELYVLAVAAVALVIAAVIAARVQNVDVTVQRAVHPPRVHAGTASRVDLEIRNRGRRRTPVLSVRDPFDRGWRWARFLVPPIGPSGRLRAAYRLPTDERGIFDIGPLECMFSDPFGLVRTQFTTVGVTQLTVYPRIDQVSPLPTSEGQDPHSGARQASALLGAGDEFYALRQYEVGDDTRRVHWPSTARLDELMIRQDEMPWQTRATILLDVRARVNTRESLEIAVSAAASVHAAQRRRGSLLRLVTTDGTDSGFSAGSAHSEAILEHLATVDATRHDRLAGVAATLRRAGNGGSLAIITTDRAPASDLDALARLRTRYGTLVLVLVEQSAYDPGVPVRHSLKGVPAVTAVVRVTRDAPFARAWESTLALTGSRR